ncbi:MAG: signal peptide peptidase SppA [candidate division KSB1 bacterium]|nr:signal peptide peptidase SppA [candidate division KSB1 bacterium]MDZ7365750.1 signal peptide peptidase SppA [candidate division KSB1 bacterium]MDZ7403770.1 signal peptide peptidase SppA [candidate division KSB1 bacterium]
MARGRDWFLGLLLAAALGVFIFFIFSLLFGVSDDGYARRGFSLHTGKRIGVVEIEGIILDSKNAVEQLERFQEDGSISAVILRIDSPGGGVAASQEIYEAAKRVRQSGKFVIASMGSVAASGGYYIACAAETIMANPGTTTGSIGVISELINMTELLNKIGIRFDVIKSGKYKDSGSPFRPMNEEDRKYFQSYVDDAYEQFVGVVAAARRMEKAEVLKHADGRVFTGQQALALGLIDRLGTYQDAIALAAEVTGIEGRPRVVTPRKRRVTIWDIIFGDIEEHLIRLQTLPVLRYQWVL